MDAGPRTARAADDQDALHRRVVDWVLIRGDRRLVAAGIAVLIVTCFGGLVAGGVVAVGAGSSTSSVFGSGLTAGIVTLVTIAASINQLVLSRVFGSPNQLFDRLHGARNLREGVREHATESTSSNDPAAFISLLARTLTEHATTARSILVQGAGDPPTAVTSSLDDVAAYGRSIDDQVEPETQIRNVLGIILGTEYAVNMAAVRYLRTEYGESLGPDVLTELRAMEDLLESLAVTRQFFKTIALQQDFASLSRLLVYSGLAALLTSVSLTLVYRSSSVTVPAGTLPLVVPLAFGVVVLPFALFASFILRAASVGYRTVSVGPFVPPGER